jgi:hypothetical protein
VLEWSGRHSRSKISESTVISPVGFPGDRGTSFRWARSKTLTEWTAKPLERLGILTGHRTDRTDPKTAE